ncbi:MAG: zinc-ribbon protein [Myxococcales bacterium]|nr:zinc-ribbon protein [Myxococcales bacterium]
MTYSSPMDSYVSARGRALALQILVIVQLVLHGLSMVGYGAGRLLLHGDFSGGIAAIVVASVIGGFEWLLFIAASVVFLTWVHRSIANLPALGSLNCRFTPSGAVWSYLIPFVNLVRGHQVMATIWTESQPALMNENGFHLPLKTTIVNWWWAMCLVSYFGRKLVRADLFSANRLSTATVEQLVLLAISGAAGLLFLKMVRRAQERQDAMWEDLERRRTVPPQPTADYLR